MESKDYIKDFISKESPWEYNFEFECGDEEYTKLDTLERYFIYRIFPVGTVYEKTNKFIKENFGFYPMSDPDGSGEAYYPIIHEIYKHLWGWKKSENTFGNIGNEIFADCLFGGDTMNSVQTVFNSFVKELIGEFHNLPDKKGNFSFNYILECWLSNSKFKRCLNSQAKLKKYINAYHTLGNFVLVPAGFNGNRGTKLSLCKNEETPGFTQHEDGKYYKKIDDYWDLSLEYLAENGYSYNITKNQKSVFENKKESFNWYINYFFLWDYVKPDYSAQPLSPKNNNIDAIKKFFVTATDLIKRRGKFMTAMLMIQKDEQSDLYTRIQNDLFAKNDILLSGIDKAAEEVLKRFESDMPENAKRLLDELKKGEV